jgi:hypothetical protein
MEEPGEQCTVVFALIVTELAGEYVCRGAGGVASAGYVTIYAKTTVHCFPDSSMKIMMYTFFVQVW